jgi:hypothetical protein
MTTSHPLERNLRLTLEDGEWSGMLTDSGVWAGSEQGGELWKFYYFGDFVVWKYSELSARNSYGYRKSHIYETVKLNQTKLSNQLSCGEREKTFKALIDHDLA